MPFGRYISWRAQLTDPIPIALNPFDRLVLAFHNAAKPTQWEILDGNQ